MSFTHDYLDPFFDLLGNEDRRIIMFSLHGSEYLRHHDSDDPHESGCLATSEVMSIIEKDRSTTLYHLRELEKGGLVERISRLRNGKAVLMWKITDKWREFVQDFDFQTIIQDTIRSRYPSLIPT